MSRTVTPACPDCGQTLKGFPLAPATCTYRVKLGHPQGCRTVAEVRPDGSLETISVPPDRRIEDVLVEGSTVCAA